MKVIALVLFFSGVTLGAPQNTLKPMLDGRIVGGIDTTIEEHPYQISLQRRNSHICGGAIISTNWIVTAAHCVDVTLTSEYSIRVGSTIRNSGGSVHDVSRIVIHPDYRSLDYDIAVLLLSTPLEFGAGVQAIGLAPAGPGPVAGSIAVLTGWGTTSEGGTSALVLQEVDVPIVSQTDCRAAYSVASITDRMFCAGLLGVGGKDACQGDSGGPVVVAGLLTGLVSWGNGCARPNFPGVKTNIPSMRQWLTDTTGV